MKEHILTEEQLMQKNIPVLTVSRTTLAEAYEKALVESNPKRYSVPNAV